MYKFRSPERLIACASSLLDNLVYLEQYNEEGFFEKPAPAYNWNPPLDMNGKRGGAFCVSTLQGLVVCQAFVGDIPEDELSDHWRLTAENARCLSLFEMHLSSWQSRNAFKETGGAVRGDEFILSFHGLPELWNEALMLLVAVQSDSMNLKRADIIAGISSNPYWAQLRKVYFE